MKSPSIVVRILQFVSQIIGKIFISIKRILFTSESYDPILVLSNFTIQAIRPSQVKSQLVNGIRGIDMNIIFILYSYFDSDVLYGSVIMFIYI